MIGQTVSFKSYDINTETLYDSDSYYMDYVNISNNFNGKVYCLRVPSEVFLVRRNGKCSFTGNSSRHGK
jgi:TATA-box binding protein (TBP) (component of TFIID and TFIIIB)